MPSYMSYGLDSSDECCPKTIPIGVRSTEFFENGGTTEHGKRSTMRFERKCAPSVVRIDWLSMIAAVGDDSPIASTRLRAILSNLEDGFSERLGDTG